MIQHLVFLHFIRNKYKGRRGGIALCALYLFSSCCSADISDCGHCLFCWSELFNLYLSTGGMKSKLLRELLVMGTCTWMDAALQRALWAVHCWWSIRDAGWQIWFYNPEFHENVLYVRFDLPPTFQEHSDYINQLIHPVNRNSFRYWMGQT